MGSSSLQECFAAQLARTPESVAVSSGPVQLTYRELDERANQLAHRLIGLGVRPETPVAVLMERSAEVLVAILAIVKAGAFYLPLHGSYPLERMQWILDQAGWPTLITNEARARRELPRAGEVLVIDADPQLADLPCFDPGITTHPDQLAYAMYTSGSTGQPKGVAVTHRDALALALDGCWDTGNHERVLMVAPHAFGVSTYEVWVPLLHGGQIVVAPAGDVDVSALRRLIRDERITGMHLTAGLFRLVAEEAPETFATVREVLTGGDVVTPTAVQRVLNACPNTVVRATYGATETTAFTVNMPMTSGFPTSSGVPIGGAMDDIRLYILDANLRPVEAGVAGELYVAGSRLARGYLGRADLTAERFVADPFHGGGERMYRTGDLARWNAAGLVDLLGRADQQVKIRGFRVELSEVETVLSKFSGLADVAVIARDGEPGEKLLAAYIVAESAGIDINALRTHAGELLPDYMVPSAFVVLEALPLTPNGKLDRAALPAPDFESASRYRSPQGALQERLCVIFAEVLGVSKVGIDDDFFELGGQSLSAMRLISRIESELGIELSIGVFFNASTVADLSGQLEG
jgi:amino acid adenylation domain-containing protein